MPWIFNPGPSMLPGQWWFGRFFSRHSLLFLPSPRGDYIEFDRTPRSHSAGELGMGRCVESDLVWIRHPDASSHRACVGIFRKKLSFIWFIFLFSRRVLLCASRQFL